MANATSRARLAQIFALMILGASGAACRYVLGLTDRYEGEDPSGVDSGSNDSGADGAPNAGPDCEGVNCVPRSCREGSTSGTGTNCSSSQNRFCCESLVIDGGTFRLNDGNASVSPFRIDSFEVTVGRFKTFLALGLGTKKNPPPDNSGFIESVDRPLTGWRSTWNAQLTEDAGDLEGKIFGCNSDVGGFWNTGDDRLAMGCVTWFEALAFCIWDGGRLPTEAEWAFVAMGGAEQRPYPWGSDPPTREKAQYCTLWSDASVPPTLNNVTTVCGNGPTMIPVGSKPPSAFNLFDLAGSQGEWIFDWYVETPSTPCNDCAEVDPRNGQSASERVVRGGSWIYPENLLRNSTRDFATPRRRNAGLGFRCARNISEKKK